jgi:glycosyltransferase involved in cell wall biosynthesis
MVKKKCVFLIPNGGNFSKIEGKSIIGSSTHIGIGIEQLSKYYEVHIITIDSKTQGNKFSDKNKRPARKALIDNKMLGLFRDIKSLLKNNLQFFRLYKKIHKIHPDFLFERSEYLSFSGVVIAHLMKIPHFYEANWVHYKGIQQFYSSWANPVAKRIEEWMYSLSTHVFFVGNQNLLLKLRKANWNIIQNGVSEKIIDKYKEHLNEPANNGVLNICVLASLMKHHRMDIFIEALSKLNNKDKIKVYFIGVNFESIIPMVPSAIQYEYLGPLNKTELYDVLSSMNIAVISGGPFYSSFMKLYDYAAVKLAVVCPNLSNLISVFNSNELLYFDNEDSGSLAQKIDFLIREPQQITVLGNNLNLKVGANFTWERIFENISNVISEKIGKK